MAKVNQLTSAFLKTAPSGKYLDGLGLWYVKRPNGGSQWMLRISLGAKRREMGLGGFPDVSLKEARGLAADYRKSGTRHRCQVHHCGYGAGNLKPKRDEQKLRCDR